MRTLLIAATTICVVCLAVTGAGAARLYAVRLADGATLAAVEDLGAVVRHVGLAEAIVEGDERVGDDLVAGGHAVRRLAEPRAAGELYVCYMVASVELIDRVAEVLWSEPGGAIIVSCEREWVDALRASSFSVFQLPESIDVGSWFDNTPPAHLRDRTRDDERAIRGAVSEVIASIQEGALEEHVRALSEDYGSRFVYRWECEGGDTPCIPARDYIIDNLEFCLPESVETQRFDLSGGRCAYGPDSAYVVYPQDNIIGVLPGTGGRVPGTPRLPGCYIVCAHYDAIATSTVDFPNPVTNPPFYWWCENDAPGADDNATGVATVLEVARALSTSKLTFDFDIRFVLFSGEEVGLWGSKAYADYIAGLQDPYDTIYGVLNVDMIGYRSLGGDTDACHIVTNPASVWLADWIVETAESELYADLFPMFDATRIDVAHPYSDHKRFWDHGYDAIIAIEHEDPRDANEYYHTIDDVVDNIHPSQLTATTRMIAGAVARLANTEGQFNLAVFPDDLVFPGFRYDGSEYQKDHLVTGELSQAKVEFHAFGPADTVDVTLEVWDGPPDEGELLTSAWFPPGAMGGGEVRTHEFEWDLTGAEVTDHLLSVRLVVDGADESTTADNVVQGIRVRVDAPELYIANHFTWPNPARSIEELRIAYRLSRATEGSVEIRVFDLLGQEIVKTSLFYNPTSTDDGVQPGLNSIAWETLDTSGSSLAPGVYVYQITLYDSEATELTDQKMGKFAIMR